MTHNLRPYATYKEYGVLWGENVLPSEEELRAKLVREQCLLAEKMVDADDNVVVGE
jgi:hypothetical protein